MTAAAVGYEQVQAWVAVMLEVVKISV